MRRVQIQLDEPTYEALRRRAFARRQSLAAAVREVLRQGLGGTRRSRRLRVEDLRFVGSASSKDPYPVSEQHDRALAEEEW